MNYTKTLDLLIAQTLATLGLPKQKEELVLTMLKTVYMAGKTAGVKETLALIKERKI